MKGMNESVPRTGVGQISDAAETASGANQIALI